MTRGLREGLNGHTYLPTCLLRSLLSLAVQGLMMSSEGETNFLSLRAQTRSIGQIGGEGASSNRDGPWAGKGGQGKTHFSASILDFNT